MIWTTSAGSLVIQACCAIVSLKEMILCNKDEIKMAMLKDGDNRWIRIDSACLKSNKLAQRERER